MNLRNICEWVNSAKIGLKAMSNCQRTFYFLAIIAWATFAGMADDLADQKSKLKSAAEKSLVSARAQHKATFQSAVTARKLASACFDRAEFAENDSERAALAREGLAICRDWLVRHPKDAGGHFFLAMNLGQLARTMNLGALKLVDEMEQSFSKARELDDKYEYAGPDRNLGQLYHQAPGWPISLGDKKKARRHFERALEIAPDYPANRLNLIEANMVWGENAIVIEQRRALEESLPKARKAFAGERWEAHWASWEERLRKIRMSTGE